MKLSYSLLVFLFTALGCNNKASGQGLPLAITGKISKPLEGMIYLDRINDRNIGIRIDSSTIQNQSFTFNTKIEEPGVYQLNIANQQIIGLILDGGEKLAITAEGYSETGNPPTANIEGSPNMVLFQDIIKTVQEQNTKKTAIEQQFKNEKSEKGQNEIREEYQALMSENSSTLRPKIEQLGTSLTAIIAANNFLTPEHNTDFLNKLKDKLIAEKKDHFFAKLFIQTVNKANLGKPGTPAPDFTVTDLNGRNVKLSDYKGKVVILDFWATWCGPCIQSFPAMQIAVEKHKNNPDVVFLFVNTFERVSDDQWKTHVEKFAKNRGYDKLNVVLDIGNKTSSAFGVEGIPAKFCIDKEGLIKHKASGYSGDPNQVVNEISHWIEN